MRPHRISYSVEGGIARLTLDNPKGRNSVDEAFVESFSDCAGRCAEDESVKVIVVAASGDFFSVGGNLADFLSHEADIENYVRRLAKIFHLGVERLHGAAAPVVLALKGMAAGGGFSLVCGADIVIAARSAKLVSAYTRTGLTPDGGATYFLERIVGYRKAFDIMALNQVSSAEEACLLGIVNKVVEDDQLDAATETLALKILETPSDAIIRLKGLMRHSAGATLHEQLAREAEGIAAQAGHPKTLESLRGFFK